MSAAAAAVAAAAAAAEASLYMATFKQNKVKRN